MCVLVHSSLKQAGNYEIQFLLLFISLVYRCATCTGRIPEHLAALIKLERLSLCKNQLNGEGGVPSVIFIVLKHMMEPTWRRVGESWPRYFHPSVSPVSFFSLGKDFAVCSRLRARLGQSLPTVAPQFGIDRIERGSWICVFQKNSLAFASLSILLREIDSMLYPKQMSKRIPHMNCR